MLSLAFRCSRSLLACCLLLISLQAVLAQDKPEKNTAKLALRPLDVLLNNSPMGQWTLLEQDGALYATAEVMKEWRLSPPADGPALQYRGKTWLPLYVLPGYRARFDFSSQSMALEFSPTAFLGSRLSQDRHLPPPLSPMVPAVFLNYDLSHSLSASSLAPMSRNTGALGEFGLALGKGTLVSSHVGLNLGSHTPDQPQQWRRLETLWTQDFQSQNQTLRLGDTSTRSSMWGRTLYFGGLQIGSNFGLSPGFVSQPIPSISGTASGPGTVELYINNVLRQTNHVQPGPFTVENFSQLTGAGEARVVVRDVLGRETVVVQPFFTNNNLLAPDLQDWSLSLGRERFNLGTLNSDYRDRFASGLYRRGITDSLSLEGKADWKRTRQSLGLGINTSLPWQSLGQAALALSQDDGSGKGAKLLFGIDQQSVNHGIGVRVVAASRAYRELGYGSSELPYQIEQAINYRLTLDQRSALSFTAARLKSYELGSNQVLGAAYSMRLGERGSLVFSANRVSGNVQGHSIGVSLLLPLDNKQLVSSSVNQHQNGRDAYVSTSSPLTGEIGTGWRALGGHRNSQNYAEGGVYYQGSQSFLSADLSAASQNQTLRLNAQGALVGIDGRGFAARRVQESFALVEVRGYPNVGVGFQGAALTQTDSEGLALLPRLMSYQNNHIRLNANDLPFSAELDSIEQISVPAWRSAVKVVFPVRSGRGALIKLVLDDGQGVPAGTQVDLVGDSKEFFVNRRGEAFVTGLQTSNVLRLNWKTQSCDVAVLLPAGQSDDILRLGPLLCAGVKR